MKNLFCTAKVPGSGASEYQCMSAAFYVSQEGEGVTLQCSICKTVYRMEDLEAGQRVNVIVDRGIGEETFEAATNGKGFRLLRPEEYASACKPATCTCFGPDSDCRLHGL